MTSFRCTHPCRRRSSGDQDLGGHDPRQAVNGDRREGPLHEGAGRAAVGEMSFSLFFPP